MTISEPVTHTGPPDSLEQLGGEPLGDDGAFMEEKVVVAPARGKFRFAQPQHFTSEGEYVLEGQVIGNVISKDTDGVAVTAPHSGWVMKFFVRDGWPVQAGQPVLSLRLL